MNCYAFFLLGIGLSIYFLSKNVTVEEYGGGRGGGRGRGRGYGGGIGRGHGGHGGYYGGHGGYYGGRGGYYGSLGGYYGRGGGAILDVNPFYIYDNTEDYYQYPYWYKYIPFLNYY